MAIPKLTPVADALHALADDRWDAVVIVSPIASLAQLPPAHALIEQARSLDARVGEEVVVLLSPEVAGGRLVFAPTGPVDRDYDDVRRYAEAALSGVRRARDAGAQRPLLLVPGLPADPAYRHAAEVAVLGALAGLWEPLEAREVHGSRQIEPVVELGFEIGGDADHASVARQLAGVEEGRRLARDLAGSNPERMRPDAFAQMCVKAFHGTKVRVKVIDDGDRLQQGYPLLSAVARASQWVERHRPRVLRLTYTGGESPSETLLLAGKGVTYDTGGADLKVGGHMAGMSRDKGGAAAVAGLLKTIAELEPEGLRVVAELGLVRNSIGADAYVADEIIPSHAGVRVRVGNTDAEGRMVLADLLSHLRIEARDAPRPRILSVATLTGHAVRAVGPYSIGMDNGPARQAGVAQSLEAAGDEWGEPFELSRLRREDFDFVQPRTDAYDVLQCNNAASVHTNRGHQFPMAFLSMASGLAKHDNHADSPLCYTHVDIGGSACVDSDWQHGRPTGAPVLALAARWVLGRPTG